MLDYLHGIAEFKPIDEQADDDVMHFFEFREANGFSGQAFYPSA